MAQTPGPNELRNPLARQELLKASIWIGLAALLAIAWLVAQPILLIFAAIVFAAMLDGGTRLLGRVLPIGRGWRLAIVLVAAVGFLGWTVMFAGTQLAAQANQLQQVIVAQVNNLIALAKQYGVADINFDPQKALEYLAGSMGQVTAAVGTVIGGLTSLFLIFVLGIYFAIEPRLYERGLAWMLPSRSRAHFYDVTAEMGRTLRRLMAGRLLGMVIEGVGTGVLLAIYGIPMAALLGIITGLLVFIPNIGAIISGVLMVLVGFSTGVNGGLYALAVYIVVQTVDGNIIVPMVAKRTVDLAPALVLGAQLLFGALFGILGLALADPIVAMIKVALEKNAARAAKLAGVPATATTEPDAPAAKPKRPATTTRRRTTRKA
jgi:predicted PurR-regulated permease PerM